LLRENNELVKELCTPAPDAKDLYFPDDYAQNAWKQFTTCLWKQIWAYWRSPGYNLVRLTFTLTLTFMPNLFLVSMLNTFFKTAGIHFRSILTIYASDLVGCACFISPELNYLLGQNPFRLVFRLSATI